MMHSETAIAIASATGARWDEYAADRGWSAVGIAPGGMHRDSDALDRSNNRVILEQLRAVDSERVDVAAEAMA